MLGTNFKDTLLKHIDASSLPAKYGGNCTCSHMEGGCVPKLGPQGPTVFTEDVDEEMELVEGEPDFEYKTKSSHGQFHFNLEILPGMVQKDQATVSVAFIADVPLSFEAKDAVTGEVIYQGQFDEGNSTRKLAFNVTNTPANYNLIWNADGKDFGLEFGVDIKE